MSQGGILELALLRSAPVAPFAAINLAAGAAGVRMRDFILATALGMAPGTVTIAWFGDRLQHFLRSPTGWNFSALVTALLLFVAIAHLTDSVVAKHRRRSTEGPPRGRQVDILEKGR